LIDEVLGGRAGESAPRDGFGEGLGHEGVGEDFLESGSLGGIEDEDLADEVAGVLGNGDVFGEGVAAGLDLLVGGLDLGGLEGRLADELRVAG
jgi:hypothetical protein